MQAQIGNSGGKVFVVSAAVLKRLIREGDAAFVTAASKASKTVVAKTATTATDRRGRVPGNYFPNAGKKLASDVNPKVAKVFAMIKAHRKGGITQKEIVRSSKLPNSTVWYALVKLRDLKAVSYKAA